MATPPKTNASTEKTPVKPLYDFETMTAEEASALLEDPEKDHNLGDLQRLQKISGT